MPVLFKVDSFKGLRILAFDGPVVFEQVLVVSQVILSFVRGRGARSGDRIRLCRWPLGDTWGPLFLASVVVG